MPRKPNPEGQYARKKILDYIIKHKINNDGVAPSMREIMAACDIPSTSTVSYHLYVMRDKEKTIYFPDNNVSRSIEVMGGRWYPPKGWKN